MKTVALSSVKFLAAILFAGTFFTFHLLGQCVVPSPGLVSWWRAENTAADAAGTNSGVLVNGVTFTPGVVGRCFNFDGASAHVRVSDNPSLHFTNALSIEGWIYPTDVGGAYHDILTRWDIISGIEQRSFGTGIIPNGSLAFSLCPDGTASPNIIVIQSTNPIPVNQWTYFADTYDGTTIKLYINGVLHAQAAYNLGIFAGNDALGIGASIGGGAPGQFISPYKGKIDEIAIYNRALSASEVQFLYNAGNAGKCAAPNITTQPHDLTVNSGSTAAFAVAVDGSAPLYYQWRHRGTNVPNATSASLVIAGAQSFHAGVYTVIVSNLVGTAISSNAVLTVKPPWVIGRTGNVVAWGDNQFGQTNVPPDLTNALAVSTGSYHNLALRADRTVAVWGDNGSGQTNIPPGLSNVVAISAGYVHSLALKEDGTVIAWGSDYSGQTEVPLGLSNVVAVSAGHHTSLALKNDGTVVQWPTNWPDPPPANLSNVVAIANGGFSDGDNRVVLLNNGQLVTWGLWPSLPPADLAYAQAIAAGSGRGFALLADGTVTQWGWADPQPAGLSGIAAIANEVALKQDGTIVTWVPDDVAAGLSNVFAISSTLALVGTGPPQQSTLLVSPRLDSGSFSVSLSSSSGRVYALEYKNSLSDATWTALPLVAGTGGLLTLTDSNAAGPQRFYRVKRW